MNASGVTILNPINSNVESVLCATVATVTLSVAGPRHQILVSGETDLFVPVAPGVVQWGVKVDGVVADGYYERVVNGANNGIDTIGTNTVIGVGPGTHTFQLMVGDSGAPCATVRASTFHAVDLGAAP